MDVEEIWLKVESLEDSSVVLKEFVLEKMILFGKKIDTTNEEHRRTTLQIKNDLKTLRSRINPEPKQRLKERVRRTPLTTLRQIEKEKLKQHILKGKEDSFKTTYFPGRGKGVLSNKDIYKGEYVLNYKGSLIDNKTAKERERVYEETASDVGCYMLYFRHENVSWCIDATTDDGSFGRLINHSRLNSNLKAKSIQIENHLYVYFVATKNILKNEELLYDYGDRRKDIVQFNPWLKE